MEKENIKPAALEVQDSLSVQQRDEGRVTIRY